MIWLICRGVTLEEDFNALQGILERLAAHYVERDESSPLAPMIDRAGIDYDV